MSTQVALARAVTQATRGVTQQTLTTTGNPRKKAVDPDYYRRRRPQLQGSGPIVHAGHAGSPLWYQPDYGLRELHNVAQTRAQVPGCRTGFLAPDEGGSQGTHVGVHE